MSDYKYECISSGVYAAVSDKHTFGTDSILLADFAHPLKKDIVLDMGTGCGILPLIWLKLKLENPIYCIDIQETAVEQVISGIKRSNAEGKIIAECVDLRSMDNNFKTQSFSLITMNPPYKAALSGKMPQENEKKIAKQELMCNMEDVAAAASKFLKQGGRFCMCNRPERLVDVIYVLKKHNLEPKRLRFVSDRPGLPPFLFLLESKKCAKPFLNVSSELFIKDTDGSITEEVRNIYGDYAEEKNT